MLTYRGFVINAQKQSTIRLNPRKENIQWYRWIIALVVAVGLTASVAVFWFQQRSNIDTRHAWDDIRLPSFVKPRHYHLAVETDLDNLRFGGNVTIDFELTEKTTFIVVHAVDLKIYHVQLNTESNDPDPVAVRRITYNADKMYHIVHFDRNIRPGVYRLQITYFGSLKNNLHGYYYSTYVDQTSGQKRRMAVTQFEPIDARRAFPCFDEPAMKATFDITMFVKPGLDAISNMELIEKSKLDHVELVKYEFERSPPMSTYLVAFAVGDFGYVEDTTSNPHIRVLAPKGQEHRGTYALQVARKVLKYYEDLFGIPFPLKKLDMLAVNDFSAGAMENWGLITYRDTEILYDAQNTSDSGMIRLTSTIAHELAHQWFGNLVTMKWWDALFLNEAFAEFMQYHAVENFRPELQYGDFFYLDEQYSAMDKDASIYTHAVKMPLNDPRQMEELFDDITYAKGSSLLRMLFSYLETAMPTKDGARPYFFERLSHYLQDNAYNNTNPKDLWRYIDTDDKQLQIEEIMNDWINNPGYPVLLVRRQDGEIEVQQQGFLSKTWRVPVTAVDSTGTTSSFIIKDAPYHVRTTHHLKFNHHQAGFYRVCYSSELLHEFMGFWTKLHGVDRAGLLNDALACAYDGHITIQDYKTLVDQFVSIMVTEQPLDHVAWTIIGRHVSSLNRILPVDVFRDQERVLSNYVKAHSLWRNRNDETVREKYGRLSILSTAERLGVLDIKEAQTLYDEYSETGQLPRNVTMDIFEIAMRVVAKTEQGFWQIMDVEPYNPTEAYLRALRSASYTPHRRLSYTLLSLIWEGNKSSTDYTLRSQHISWLLRSVASNSDTGLLTTWNFIRDHWDKIVQRMGDSELTKFSRVIGDIIGMMSSEHQLQDVKAFFSNRTHSTLKRNVNRGLEKAEKNWKFARRVLKEFA